MPQKKRHHPSEGGRAIFRSAHTCARCEDQTPDLVLLHGRNNVAGADFHNVESLVRAVRLTEYAKNCFCPFDRLANEGRIVDISLSKSQAGRSVAEFVGRTHQGVDTVTGVQRLLDNVSSCAAAGAK